MLPKLLNRNSKLFTIIILLLPFLTIYKSPISRIDFGSFCLIGIYILALIFHKINSKICYSDLKLWFIYIVYILIVTVVASFSVLYQNIDYIFLRMLKFFMYICFLLSFKSSNLFSLYYAVKYIKNISIIATLFLLIQIIGRKLFSITILGYIPSLVSESHSAYISRAVYATNSTIERFASFTAEPAHYAMFIILALILLLFSEFEIKNRVSIAVFLTIGILISTSAQGIGCSIIVWGAWLLFNKYNIKTKKLFYTKVFLFTVGIAGIIYYFNSSYGQFVLERLFTETHYGNAVLARTSTIFEFFQQGVNVISILFGMGYGNVDTSLYYSSWAFNLWTLGIIGTLYTVYIYYHYYEESEVLSSKFLILMNFIAGFFSTSFMSDNLLLWFIIIFAINDFNKQIKQKNLQEDKMQILNNGSKSNTGLNNRGY